MSKNIEKRIAVIGVKGLPSFGGCARTNENIVKILNNKYKFTFYVLKSHHDLKYKIENVNFVQIGNHFNQNVSVALYYWKVFFHVLFKKKYDLIFINHYSSGIIIPFLRLKYSVVAALHGAGKDNKFHGFGKFYIKLSEYAFFKAANTIISVSKEHLEYAKKFNVQNIYYIPNGINLNEKITYTEMADKDYLVFAAARIYDIKGLHTLLKALKRINIDRKLIVIGDLSQVPAYKKLILQLSEGLNVEYRGLIKDKNKLFSYIKNACLFIFPSVNEGMSNMLLEVASIKTPVIASDIPANTTVFNEEEMLFFPVEDEAVLSEKIVWSLKENAMMKKKAQNAYEKISKMYTWESAAKKYSEIFDKYFIDK